MRTIVTPPGLGDFIWLAMKLVNQKEQFKVVMSDGTPQRGHQLKDLLPGLISEHEYRSGLKYRTINDNNAANGKKKWSQIASQEFYLSANRHLEEGRRIEEFLPDLPTSFKLDYTTSDDDKLNAEILLPEGTKYIGIYTSAYSNARNWNGWGSEEWFSLIKSLAPGKYIFVLIGADYDTGVTDTLLPALKSESIPYINSIGQPLGVVVEMLKRLHYFIGFPSGLSIINETLGKDGTMFYPNGNNDSKTNLSKMINAWADPVRIANGSYKGCLWCAPEQIFDWLNNNYKIFDR